MPKINKCINTISIVLLFSYLFFFPFGQLLKIPVTFLGIREQINLTDLIVFAALPLFAFPETIKPKINKYFADFFYALIFSFSISLFILPLQTVAVGSFYLIRLVSYYAFFVLVWNLIKKGLITRNLLINGLLVATHVTALFGWLQYFYFPDLVDLKYLGWDDHLFRLAGTFLDPAFTAIILVFGTLISFGKSVEKKSIWWVLSFLFLLVSVAYTYNRASYLALASGVLFLGYRNNLKVFKFRYILAVIATFLVIIVTLPRFKSEGTLLERTASINAKVVNVGETLSIIRRQPLFGVGFNNICHYRLEIFGGNPDSHACSGADSSIMFLLATTGVVGFFVFLFLLREIQRSLDDSHSSVVFKSISIALFVNSLFVQSAFYPFVMGYMGILYAATLKDQG